jgi:hypothetical protein
MRSISQTLEESDVPPEEASVGMVLMLVSFVVCAAICSTAVSLAALS